jgi:hypothetical protein
MTFCAACFKELLLRWWDDSRRCSVETRGVSMEEVDERALRAFCSCAYMCAAATEDIFVVCGVAVAGVANMLLIGCCEECVIGSLSFECDVVKKIV